MASQEILDQIRKNPCDAGDCAAPQADCYIGQWTVHGPHHVEMILPKWKGGGTIQSHCPGKTAATVLPGLER